MKTAMTISVYMKRAGYIDAGEWRPPTWEANYFDKYQRVLPIKCKGDKPIGQELLDAVAKYGSETLRKMTSHEIFDAVKMVP